MEIPEKVQILNGVIWDILDFQVYHVLILSNIRAARVWVTHKYNFVRFTDQLVVYLDVLSPELKLFDVGLLFGRDFQILDENVGQLSCLWIYDRDSKFSQDHREFHRFLVCNYLIILQIIDELIFRELICVTNSYDF